ncbi:MAG: Na+/H+ antiporter NhaA [Gemmatimonadota bacterium]|nr:Na+/H+ antiporter NhaA [Gemmatimonadota bacterium]
MGASTIAKPPVPARIVGRVLRPFREFAQAESAGGIVLLVCTAIAVVWANSPWGESYFRLWERRVTIGGATVGLTETLHHWINDGLMAVFFFLVGLEIKRELLVGELASIRQAALPIAAAAGGMVVPAVLYSILNGGGPGAPGWAIPMATDIAFALGILALLGDRVPISLKVFLTALAIIDDIGAVLVIALFYTTGVSWGHLAVAGAVFTTLAFCNAGGVRHPVVYAMGGVALWVAFLKSGVHATVAGVALAMTIPSRTRIDPNEFLARVRSSADDFERAGAPGTHVLTNEAQQDAIAEIEDVCEGAQSPLLRLEHGLQAAVAFGIVPLFALANAGVRIGSDVGVALANPVSLGVMLGLLVGKPIGIMMASWLAVWASVAVLPSGIPWKAIHGVSLLAGIGFTMSLFIGALAFPDSPLQDSAKLGILAASFVAAVLGGLLLRASLRDSPRPAP